MHFTTGAREVVVSVPHSGTRTLVKHLGIRAEEQGLSGQGSHWHFNRTVYSLLKLNIVAHIPIRHPLDVARSWANRNITGDAKAAMLDAYDWMLRFIERSPERCRFHRMEDIAVLAGAGEWSDPNAARVEVFQDAVRERVIGPHRAFFECFYDLS